MDRNEVLCKKCFSLIEERLTDDDWNVLTTIYREGPMNRDSIISKTDLSTFKVRESVARLCGACLIDITKYGSNTIITLTPTGQHYCKLLYIKSQKSQRRTDYEEA